MSAVDIVFDDPNLIADGGLVSVVALAEQVGPARAGRRPGDDHGGCQQRGGEPVGEGDVAGCGDGRGADSIEDMHRLRHAGNAVVFDEIRAPSTLGTFLRAFTHGHVQRLNAVLRRSLIALAERTPLLPGADEVVFVDLDSTHRQVYGYAKQGAAVGRLTGKKTLHPLLLTASTPIARPGAGRGTDAAGQVRRRAGGAPVVGRGPGPRCAPSRPPRGSWSEAIPSSTPPRGCG